MLQQSALNILKSGKNVFLTGSAGSGKTYLVNRYIDYLRERDAKVAVTASTGISATHIGGRTIHSWSGLGIRDELGERDLDNIAKKAPVRARIAKARVLIIDEISMLSAQTLTCVEQILRHIKGNSSPFGGIQVVFSGDFFQLPPVMRDAVPSAQKMAFTAPAWERANLDICYLSESHRHGDDVLLRLLNEIRSGEVSPDCHEMLARNMRENGGGDSDDDAGGDVDDGRQSAVKLHTHNADVDAANARKLEQLPGGARRFEATTSGVSQAAVDALMKNVMAPQCLQVKRDAQVMFVKNDPEARYMNGTLGRVVDLSDKGGWPIVKTFDGERVTARPVDWNVLNEQGDVMASYTQVPLRLAWAITVHKSQGMTLDRAAVDLSKTFEPGQGYVALSRVKTWDGLQLLGCNQRALEVDSLVLEFDRQLQTLSAQAQDAITRVAEPDLNAAFDRHIIQSGGTTNANKIKRKEKRFAAAKRTDTNTYQRTKALIEAGKSLREIAAYRKVTEGTVIAHLEKLRHDHPDLDLSRFKPDEKAMAAIHAAIAQCHATATDDDLDARGNLKLSPVYRALEGKYDYGQIKLAMFFGGDDER